MAKANKLNVDLDQTDLEDFASATQEPPTDAQRSGKKTVSAPEKFERNERRGPGRPIGKKGNPAFKQYTILIRKDTHDRALSKLQKQLAKPDFSEYLEALILKDLEARRAVS